MAIRVPRPRDKENGSSHRCAHRFAMTELRSVRSAPSPVSLRTSDRCHWCGNPFPSSPVGAIAESPVGSVKRPTNGLSRAPAPTVQTTVPRRGDHWSPAPLVSVGAAISRPLPRLRRGRRPRRPADLRPCPTTGGDIPERALSPAPTQQTNVSPCHAPWISTCAAQRHTSILHSSFFILPFSPVPYSSLFPRSTTVSKAAARFSRASAASFVQKRNRSKA